MTQINRRYFDRRTVDRYVEKGLIKDGELATHMKNLPDDVNNAQYVEMDLHDAEIVDDDMDDEDIDDESDDEDNESETDEEGA